MRFFTRLKKAVINFDEYQNFSMEKLSIGIKYFIKLMLISALILAIVVTYKIYMVVDNGMLYEELESIFVENSAAKQEIIDYIEGSEGINIYPVFFLVGFVYSFILYTVLTLKDVLLLSILGFLIGRVVRVNFRYKPVLSMSFYAITLPLILTLIYTSVNLLLGFEVQYFRMAYDAISYIYIITAILIIKSDLIKQQIELIKIVEVQKQIKEEADRKKEEKKEEEKEKKEKENEKGDDGGDPKKKKEKALEPKVEPEGSQAIEHVEEL